MDLTTLTDEQLDEHRRAVLIEQERRAKLAQLPDQLAAMARDAAAAGCDRDELLERVADALTPERVAFET
ncbi:hypothetical protein [Brachybacterium massiliense]|uniref:hypothetical protein n=1 Tax=Brachybacterium massiliense TaxID=1755098 RepID=UPI000B3BCBD4|nr:hypothetical protein [Brachybacterium massiliense]